MEAMLGDILRVKQEKEKRMKKLKTCYLCGEEMDDANWRKHFNTVCPNKSKILKQLDQNSGFQ